MIANDQQSRTTGERPVAIFGGAFDPVTNAHIEIAHRVANEGFRVVIMPCSDKHVFGKRMLAAAARLELLQLAMSPEFDICTWEIETGHSRVVDSWPAVEKRYGPVHWVIGSDNAECLDRWHEGERLIRELPFIVIGRGGHPLSAKGSWCLRAPHRYLEASRFCSSTEVRAAVQRRHWDEVTTMVPLTILDAIRRRGFYA